MAAEYDPNTRDKARELMLRVARAPTVCCCCVCLARSDRKRARRVFRLTRKITRAWKAERERLTDG
jgi:hypothetical protein